MNETVAPNSTGGFVKAAPSKGFDSKQSSRLPLKTTANSRLLDQLVGGNR
jgi:hypothetical protein